MESEIVTGPRKYVKAMKRGNVGFCVFVDSFLLRDSAVKAPLNNPFRRDIASAGLERPS